MQAGIIVQTVLMFPGQGSQRVGMGESLFERYPDEEKRASDCLGYSLKTLCLKDPEGQLNQTAYTQAALYCVNAFSYRAYREEQDAPDFLVGHSLGEYNALMASGAFSFEEGLRMVQKRGQLMASMQDGGMIAVIGLTLDQIQILLGEGGCFSSIDIANINTPQQIVLAGPRDALKELSVHVRTLRKRVIVLNVSGAFHSRYMRPVQKQFYDFLETVSFRAMTIPVIANYTARRYEQGKIQDYLVSQLASPVRWVESINWLLNRGDVTFKEIGPGHVLERLLEKIRS